MTLDACRWWCDCRWLISSWFLSWFWLLHEADWAQWHWHTEAWSDSLPWSPLTRRLLWFLILLRRRRKLLIMSNWSDSSELIQLELTPWDLLQLPDSLEHQNHYEWHDDDDEQMNLLEDLWSPLPRRGGLRILLILLETCLNPRRSSSWAL